MIPKIVDLPELEPLYKKYLTSLKDHGFKGDVEYAHASRLLCATDNSVYQRMPQGVIFPKERRLHEISNTILANEHVIKERYEGLFEAYVEKLSLKVCTEHTGDLAYIMRLMW